VRDLSEKIAVHCNAESLFDQVIEKIGDGFICFFAKDRVIYPDEGTWSDKLHAERNGYFIISAERFLMEGKDEVREFKVGDRVEACSIELKTVEEAIELSKYLQWDVCGSPDSFGYAAYITINQGKITNWGREPIHFNSLGEWKATNKPTTNAKEETMSKENVVIEKVFTKENHGLVKRLIAEFGDEVPNTFQAEIDVQRDSKRYIAELERRDKEREEK
jgi:hypothetical protein